MIDYWSYLALVIYLSKRSHIPFLIKTDFVFHVVIEMDQLNLMSFLFKYHSAYLVAVYYLIIFINEPVPHGAQEFANYDNLQNACVICVTKPSLAYLCTPNQEPG